ncbi:tRNA lysidine(34) synthetase TilS [Opitutaceae bacterium]|nr:tRNA lysidine(34) synthetase TilS [Opitutaceae bacterium]
MAPARLTKWQRVAVEFGGSVGIDHLDADVVALATASGRRKWVLAVSGGADSLAMLLLVWAHWPDRREKMVVAHFNHNLRGTESRADRTFCAQVARSLGVGFETETWSDPPVSPSEAHARATRISFLERVRRKHHGRLIWTGHHLNDVAETMFMRLARGSGAAGLAAPRPIQKQSGSVAIRVRPLLGLQRAEIIGALKSAGGGWREDSSNTSSDYFRNRVRRDVIPRWEKAAHRDAVGGAGLSRRLLDEDNEALEAWLAEIDPIDVHARLVLKSLRGRPIALWRRALRAWLSRQSDVGDLSRTGFEELLKMVRMGKTTRFSLGKSGFVRIRRGFVFFEQPYAD